MKSIFFIKLLLWCLWSSVPTFAQNIYSIETRISEKGDTEIMAIPTRKMTPEEIAQVGHRTFHAQLKFYELDQFKKRDIAYHLPEFFIEMCSDCILETHIFNQDLFGIIQSKDSNIMILIDLPPLMTPTDSAKLSIWPFVDKASLSVDKMHFYAIVDDLKRLSNIEQPSLKRDVHYLSSEKAKSMFNADTVIYYDLTLKEVYKEKYPYIRAIILQKKGRGFLGMYCFYTRKAKRKIDKYMGYTKGMFMYY